MSDGWQRDSGSWPRITAVTGLAAALVVWWLLVSQTPAGIHDELPTQARNIASALLLVAGVVRLAEWWLAPQPGNARQALVLLTFGTALPAAELLGRSLRDTATLSDPDVAALRMLPLAAVFAMIVAVGWTGARCRRWRLITVASATAAIAGVTITALLPGTPIRSASLAPCWFAGELAAALGWLILARRVHLGHLVTSSRRSWLSTALVLMAGCEAVKAYRAVDPALLRSVSSGLQLAATTIAVVAALTDLRAAVIAAHHAHQHLDRQLVGTRQHLALVEEQQRERLHDARSAVLGVLGASKLLQPGPAVTADIPVDTLHALLTAELHRLQALLEAEVPEPVASFPVSEALLPIVTAHRLSGLDVVTDLDDVVAVGRSGATATAVENLLRNVAVHAPGASVLVSARAVDDRVEIVVSDDGPGIPAAERVSVLRHGVRGSAAGRTGTGLGLHSAAAAMAAQDGSLVIAPTRRGTRIVLDLPASPLSSNVHTFTLAS